jgi:cysteine desulfurase/selenocysteine lyase
VQALDCDFYALLRAQDVRPSGIGVLYGKARAAGDDAAGQGGGDMILSVSFEKTTYNEIPYKFEAGTPNIAGTIALGAALDYLTAIGMDKIAAHEHELLQYGTEALLADPGAALIGTAQGQGRRRCRSCWRASTRTTSARSSTTRAIAVRTGHHCAQPVMERFGVPATARASLALYNTRDESGRAGAGLRKVAGDVRVSEELRELYQESILDHSKRRGTRADSRARRAPRATTRCAATGPRSTSRSTATW